MIVRSTPHLVLGYHGCDKRIAEAVLAGRKNLRPSENTYDWLGHGTYFWEANPARAMAYARILKRNPRRGRPIVRHPMVLGAILDLGYSLDLLEATSIELLKHGFDRFQQSVSRRGLQMPENRKMGKSSDLLLRNLDCAVIEYTHALLKSEQEKPFDSVRGAFIEGPPIYPNAGFHAQNHIQICIRNPACIIGYFRVADNRASSARWT